MPDHLPIIDATIRVANVKDVAYNRKDGSSAIFKSIGHQNADETWLNLSVFDELLFPQVVQGAVLQIGYTEKYATMPNGAPKLYNGVQSVYRTVQTATPVGGAQVPVSGAPSTSATPTPTPATIGPDRNESIREQTSLKCAADLYAAMLSANKALKFEHETLDGIYAAVRAVLEGKSELDVALAIGVKAGFEPIPEEEPVEMPGPDAAPLPMDEPGDEDIPF